MRNGCQYQFTGGGIFPPLCCVPAFPCLILFFIIVLRTLDQFIEYHGNRTKYDNGGNHHIELEDLRAIDDQVSESSSCRQEFPDDDAYKRKADIDLHTA